MTRTIKVKPSGCFLQRARRLHIFIVARYKLTGCKKLLAWFWAVFGAAFSGISLILPAKETKIAEVTPPATSGVNIDQKIDDILTKLRKDPTIDPTTATLKQVTDRLNLDEVTCSILKRILYNRQDDMPLRQYNYRSLLGSVVEIEPSVHVPLIVAIVVFSGVEINLSVACGFCQVHSLQSLFRAAACRSIKKSNCSIFIYTTEDGQSPDLEQSTGIKLDADGDDSPQKKYPSGVCKRTGTNAQGNPVTCYLRGEP
jgi:hypothetical protein